MLTIDETDLFKKIALGDRKAFRVFYDLYRERIFVFVWQLCNSQSDAEEVVQDIFMKLWQRRETLPQVGFPKSYVYTMARNSALTLLAKIARDKKLEQQAWANMTEFENYTDKLLEAKESRLLIEQAVAQMSDKKQTVFRLSRDMGLSHKEIAEQMGLSVKTVKNILTEVLNYIRLILSRHSELLSLIFWIHSYELLI